MATPVSKRVTIGSHYESNLEGPIETVISYLQRLKTEKTREGFSDLTLDIDTYSNYEGGEYAQVILYGNRMETQEEAIFREALEKDHSDLIYRLEKRAEIRRNITSRKSVQEGKPDRIADLLEEAAKALKSIASLA